VRPETKGRKETRPPFLFAGEDSRPRRGLKYLKKKSDEREKKIRKNCRAFKSSGET